MRIIIVILIALATTGCVTAKYTQTSTTESFSVTSVFKSVDGMAASRTPEGFQIIVDKTYSHDPLRGITELLESYNKLYNMGLRFTPEVYNAED